MKKNILIIVMLLYSIHSFAQLTLNRDDRYTKKDIVISLLLGRGQFASPVFAPASNLGSVSNPTPQTGVVNGNDNSLLNMIGVEARYFLSSRIAVKLSGAAIFNTTPARESLSGVPNAIPEIEAVSAEERIDLNFIPGVEYHFPVKSKKLSPYSGLALPIIYGRHSVNNPNITVNDSSSLEGDVFGARKAAIFGLGSQLYSGVDYYFNNEIYLGAQINILGSTYTTVEKSSGNGFDISQTENVQINFLTQPVIKVGFKF